MRKSKYRGIPIYYDPKSGRIKSANFIYGIIVNLLIWMDVKFFKKTIRIKKED